MPCSASTIVEANILNDVGRGVNAKILGQKSGFWDLKVGGYRVCKMIEGEC